MMSRTKSGTKWTKRWLAWAGVAGLMLAACGGPAATEAPDQTRAGDSAAQAANLLISVKGNVNVKREGWTEYSRGMFGGLLRSGDLLKLDAGAQAQVACADLTVVAVPNGVNGVPCKVAQPVLTYNGAQVNATRAAAGVGYPVIVAPRKTKLLDGRPLLRWTAVDGAASYKVTVRGPSVEWSAETADTDLAYPADAPELAPGSTYKLVVSVEDHTSDEESTPGLGFRVLGADDAQAVRDGEARIRGLGLDSAATQLLVASLYASSDLNAEAIRALESLAQNSTEPAVLRLLGEVYLKIGLNEMAETRYLDALAASEQAADVEGQATAQHVLGQVYEAMGNAAEAQQCLEQAKSLYEKLGDATMLKQIDEQLAELRK